MSNFQKSSIERLNKQVEELTSSFKELKATQEDISNRLESIEDQIDMYGGFKEIDDQLNDLKGEISQLDNKIYG